MPKAALDRKQPLFEKSRAKTFVNAMGVVRDNAHGPAFSPA
jgi:hypothetical protein